MLSFNRVSAGYLRDSLVLKGVTFELGPGQVGALLGRNGAGKTTFLRVALGLLPAREGEVRILGGDPLRSRAWLLETGYLLDGWRYLEPRWTAWENILYHGARLGVPPRRFRDQARSLLEQFGLDGGSVVNRLSRGMRQRLRLVIAFMLSPRLVFLDEPTLGLDPDGVRLLSQRIDHHRRQGGAVLLTSQSLGFVERLADRFLLLDGGELKVEGGLREIFAALGRAVTVTLHLRYPERYSGELPPGWRRRDGVLTGPLRLAELISVLREVERSGAGLYDLTRVSPLEHQEVA